MPVTEQRQIMNVIAKAVLDAVLIAEGSVKAEAVLQGHVDTGAMVKTMKHEIVFDERTAKGIVFAEDYSVYVNVGVKAERVRYPIKVMIAWWRRKGLPTLEATRAAYATRAKHEREGIPTVNSRRFSKTGKRLGFVQDGLDKVKTEMEKVFSARLDMEFDIILNRQIVIDPILIKL